MSMFSEFANGSNADSIGKKILSSMKESPEEKIYIEKYLLPFYYEFCGDAYGCESEKIYNEIKEIFK
jgi:hypothetical protein